MKPHILYKGVIFTIAYNFPPILFPEFTFDHDTKLKDKKWLGYIIKTYFRSILSSDYLICNSTQTKGEVIKFGFDENKISVVSLGINKRFMSL